MADPLSEALAQAEKERRLSDPFSVFGAGIQSGLQNITPEMLTGNAYHKPNPWATLGMIGGASMLGSALGQYGVNRQQETTQEIENRLYDLLGQDKPDAEKLGALKQDPQLARFAPAVAREQYDTAQDTADAITRQRAMIPVAMELDRQRQEMDLKYLPEHYKIMAEYGPKAQKDPAAATKAAREELMK